MRFSSPFHFSDDRGFLKTQDNMRAINKTLNKDLRELSLWLNANKTALNVVKTEIIFLKQAIKTMMQISKLSSAEKEFMHPRMLNISSFLSMKT